MDGGPAWKRYLLGIEVAIIVVLTGWMMLDRRMRWLLSAL